MQQFFKDNNSITTANKINDQKIQFYTTEEINKHDFTKFTQIIKLVFHKVLNMITSEKNVYSIVW